MKSFESFEIAAWLDEERCLSVPVESRALKSRRVIRADRKIGLVASVVFALSTALTFDAAAMSDAQTGAAISQTSMAVSDPDHILGPPQEYWSNAIAEISKWKPVLPSDFEESPSII